MSTLGDKESLEKAIRKGRVRIETSKAQQMSCMMLLSRV